MALPKEHRLSKTDFERVFKKGKTARNSFFFIRFLSNEIGHLRAAAVVTPKISRKAVVRNRLRRMLTKAVERHNLYKKPFDVVIVITENIVGKARKEINSELEKTIDKIFVK